jgi:hypothetical protein
MKVGNMQKNNNQEFDDQLASIIRDYTELKSKPHHYDDYSDVVDDVTEQTMLTRIRAAVMRISGAESPYSKQLETVLQRRDILDWYRIGMGVGIVSALQMDLKSGYLLSVKELIHSEIFADFLEMADYLCKEGYKDAAAVIAGGTLESHLRQLCIKNGIETETLTQRGIEPKRADLLNSDLAKNSVYSKLDQKNITAWLDFRNKAAHARYSEYTKEQVKLFISGIRDFITRVPA